MRAGRRGLSTIRLLHARLIMKAQSSLNDAALADSLVQERAK
jgi:hypothetical protein